VKRRWANIFLVLAIATLLGLLFAAQLYVIYTQSKREIRWPSIFASALPFWYLWALLVPAIVGLAGSSFMLRRPRRRRPSIRPSTF
jgi:H+/Cl- antiporter ClcA